MSTPVPEPEVIVRVEGRAGRLTMNRPKALNALTLNMVRQMQKALDQWGKDPQVAVVLIDGTGDKALCAGGDVLSLYESRTRGSGEAQTFWREEYVLDAAIHRYGKPVVAIQDGIVMGGGIGISSHARYRVVTERSMLAMPETGIGLVPDVGGTWLLGHAAGELGLYLGLTGARMSGSDAIQAGFAGTFAPSSALAALKAELCDPKGRAVDEIIEALADEHAVPVSALMELKPKIDRVFGQASVEAILRELQRTTDEWAQKARAEMLTKSPICLKAALAAIRQARHLPSLEDALNVEFRLSTRLFERGEFPEGVRALLIDRDKSPKWNPPTVEAVTPALVEELFKPFASAEELGLRVPA